jgi:hypothetical protein
MVAMVSAWNVGSCNGFRMPACLLSSQHAVRPGGQRSKAAREGNRGEGAALSAGAMGISFASTVQRGCCETGVCDNF